jgi:hypothetical protein
MAESEDANYLFLSCSARLMLPLHVQDSLDADLHDEDDSDDIRTRRLVVRLRKMGFSDAKLDSLELTITLNTGAFIRLEPPSSAGFPRQRVLDLHALNRMRLRLASLEGRTIPGSASDGAEAWLRLGLRTPRLKLPKEVLLPYEHDDEPPYDLPWYMAFLPATPIVDEQTEVSLLGMLLSSSFTTYPANCTRIQSGDTIFLSTLTT